MRTRLPPLLALAVLVLCVPAGAEPADPARDLGSKDVTKRLEAVETLRKEGGPKAEALLLDALGDDDWEVVEHAAGALGERGGEKSIKPLVDVAVKGYVRRVRLAAAASLARLDPEDAAKRLGKSLRGEQGVPAADALTVLAQQGPGPAGEQLAKAVEKACKSKEAPVRAAIAGALAAFPPEERVERLEAFLHDESLAVAGAVLDHVRAAPAVPYLPAVLAVLGEAKLNDVVARRAVAAVEAILPLVEPGDATTRALATIEDLLVRAREPVVAARLATLLGRLAALPPPPPAPPEGEAPAPGEDGAAEPPPAPPPAPPPPALAPETALRLLEHALRHEGEAARAAAVQALGRIATPEALERATAFLDDRHPRVRFQALHVLVERRGLEDAATFERAVERLAHDADASVREEAAVLLGRTRSDGAPFDAAVPALAQALDDETWSVAVVAAVSLGKTRSLAAVEPLARRLDRKLTKDWRLRGAAVVGLGTLRQKPAVAHVIEALQDKDPYVRRQAYEFLLRMTKSFLPPDHDEWKGWWKYNEERYEFEDRARIAREMKKGGYAVDPVDVYDKVGSASMDVVVLQSRGDHIESLLEELGIAARFTRAAAVEEAELHSLAVFVSNCTGEVQRSDVERLQWFVRVGGYLFCSCWALQCTIEPVYPGLVRRYVTRSAVLDNVRAHECPTDSPFLEGVFRPWSQPIYVLYGSYLIEVLEPERVEVLMDSPECATTWGCGNLACWFPVGHGVILDSANHFDLQGLERVTGLRTAEDRMAYAMDHMGLDYPALRKLAAAHVWEKQAEAVKQARDLSAFRFITTFVREKRKTEP